MDECKPNFLIAGAPRCGSTSIFKVLQQVNGVYMPSNKEPHFFVNELVGSGPGKEGAETIVSAEKYFGLFNSEVARAALLRGECSIGYLFFHELSIGRIRKQLGQDVKIVLTLREPVKRAYSSYLLHRQHLTENLSFQAATSEKVEVSRKGKCWFGFQYKGLSKYADSVRAFKEAFPNIHIVILEEMSAQPMLEYHKLFRFLGIKTPPPLLSEIGHAHNHACVDRYPLFARMLNKCHKHFVPCRGLVSSVKAFQQHRPTLGTEYEVELRQFFNEDVLELEEILGRKVEFWGYH